VFPASGQQRAWMQKISLIIPLRLTAGTFEGALRLQRLCRIVPRDLFDILIVDYGTTDAQAGPIIALEAEGIEVTRHPRPEKLFSIGRARDFGVQMARQRVIMFNDIDFLAPESMYRAIHAEAMRRDLARNMLDFFCVPVLFLTEQGTGAWFEAEQQRHPFVETFSIDWLEANQADIQFTAFGSSAMVVNRHHYLTLGGHDPKFVGHGAEDYDILHRLAAMAPKGPRPHDYYTDYRDNNVRKYWGFRPCFALHGLDLFAAGLFLVHLWHPRRAERGYFRSAPNFRILRRAMRAFDRTGRQPQPLSDPYSQERWVVVYATDRDLALMRQLLPLAAGSRLVKARSLASAARLGAEASINEANRIVIAPDVRGDVSGLVTAFAKQGRSILHLEVTPEAGTYRLTDIGQRAASRIHARLADHGAPDRDHPLLFWERVELPGLPVVESGRVPAPLTFEAPLFASFGGAVIADTTMHPRPVRRRKSSLWLRIWRRLTGY